MGCCRIIFVAFVYLSLAGCMADFYLEYPTPFYDQAFYAMLTQKQIDSLQKPGVKVYLFQCDEDEMAPRSPSEEMPISCFLISNDKEKAKIYASYNFYHVDWPKFQSEKQSIQFIDYVDKTLRGNFYVGIKIVDPPHYPKFRSALTIATFEKFVKALPFIVPTNDLAVPYENNLIEYFSQASLLKFISEPFAMLGPLMTFRYVLEKICHKDIQPQERKTLVTAFLPRMIDPCFLGRLMSKAATEQGLEKELIPPNDLNDFCKVYCQFLTQSLRIMEQKAPLGCSFIEGGMCINDKCFCSRSFRMIRRLRNWCTPWRKRSLVTMLSCHNLIRIKLLRELEIEQWNVVQIGLV